MRNTMGIRRIDGVFADVAFGPKVIIFIAIAFKPIKPIKPTLSRARHIKEGL